MYQDVRYGVEISQWCVVLQLVSCDQSLCTAVHLMTTEWRTSQDNGYVRCMYVRAGCPRVEWMHTPNNDGQTGGESPVVHGPRPISRWCYGWMDGWLNGWLDRWMDGWMTNRDMASGEAQLALVFITHHVRKYNHRLGIHFYTQNYLTFPDRVVPGWTWYGTFQAVQRVAACL